MASTGMMEVTPLPGMSYVVPPEGTSVSARDGRATVACGGIPLPLREEEAATLHPDSIPSYDAIGEGIYQALRLNPGCAYADRYAEILRDAYPHLVADLASQLLMLERKDVEVPYLDRLITALRIFLLMEPDNPRFLLQIGRIYREKGLRLSALNQTTRNLYQAWSYLGRARLLLPDDPELLLLLGDVSWLLGKYDDSRASFEGCASGRGRGAENGTGGAVGAHRVRGAAAGSGGGLPGGHRGCPRSSPESGVCRGGGDPLGCAR